MAYATYEDSSTWSKRCCARSTPRVRARFPQLTREPPVRARPPFARVPMREAVRAAVERSGKAPCRSTPWSRVLDRTGVFDEAALQPRASACCRALPRRRARKLIAGCRSYGERIEVLFELSPTRRCRRSTARRTARALAGVRDRVYGRGSRRWRDATMHDPRFVDRFELFIEQREVAQRVQRAERSRTIRRRASARSSRTARAAIEEAMDFDHDYVRALQHGMPPTAGLGVGIDRLVMLLCNQASIRDVLLFPLLKPEAR